jgi:hypothetical protein
MESIIARISELNTAQEQERIIGEIRKMDFSSLTVDEIRIGIQKLRNMCSDPLTTKLVADCCVDMASQLTFEERSRPLSEQFPEINLTWADAKDLAVTALANVNALTSLNKSR